MKELHFIYQMSLVFSEPTWQHQFTLKCFPVSDELQEIKGLRVLLDPESRNFVSDDSFGNKTLCGYITDQHQLFQITVEGYATVSGNGGRKAKDEELGKYKYPSYYTKAGECIMAYDRAHPLLTESPREVALFYMQLLYQDMEYRPGVTGVTTKAEEAFANRQGVCQDYAHIMLSLLRNHHIPCRYVVGMMMGEGASHAWVEVAEDGYWYGYDPTNGKIVDDSYIKISCGRDAFDCPMNKGIMVGGGYQKQSVSVIVNDQHVLEEVL